MIEGNQTLLFLVLLMVAAVLAPVVSPAEPPPNLQTENLVPWCLVPFDASKRNPEERAKMLVRLGLRRCAYDWRQEHIAEFEEEIRQYQRHGIEFFAFWGGHDEAFRLFEKHKIHPQVWRTAPSPKAETQAGKIQSAVDSLRELAVKTGRAECPLGLYNHGGWGAGARQSGRGVPTASKGRIRACRDCLQLASRTCPCRGLAGGPGTDATLPALPQPQRHESAGRSQNPEPGSRRGGSGHAPGRLGKRLPGTGRDS